MANVTGSYPSLGGWTRVWRATIGRFSSFASRHGPAAPRISPLKYACRCLEYWAALAGLSLFRALSPDQASTLGGWLMARIGPLMPRNRVAHDNLARIYPDMARVERRKLIHDMWENFGRTAGEYPHLLEILNDPERIKFEGLDEIRTALGDHKAALLLTAHYGNWEATTAAARALGLVQANVYRPTKNERLNKVIRNLLNVTAGGGLIAKGDGNIRDMVRMLRRGVSIGLLVDQREKRGIKVPFLGTDAHTAHTPALLARRLGVPIIIGRATRVSGAHFLVECRHVPMVFSDDRQADVAAVTTRINEIYSSWIMENPEQWFWCHRRWPDERVSQSESLPVSKPGNELTYST